MNLQINNKLEISFWKGFGIGFKTFFQAIGFVFSKGLWWAFIFPIIFNILLFWGGKSLAELTTDKLEAWLLGLTQLADASSWYTSILKGAVTGFVWIAIKILFFSVFTYLGGYIVLIFMSPIFAFLSEKTEKITTGKTYSFSGEQWMRDLVRGILITLRNLFYEIAIMLLIFIASFIPVVGWLIALLSTVLLILVSAYFYGFSFMDYSMERKKLTIRQSVKFVRRHKGIAVANGLIFALAMMIPFCGVLISPFISIFSAVGATLAIQKTELAEL
ncbi:MAG: EI24 domain-containing protein [Bacteroidia bacterium]|nr:EI24 domain-containing protein [Bacteroidia bacterium]